LDHRTFAGLLANGLMKRRQRVTGFVTYTR